MNLPNRPRVKKQRMSKTHLNELIDNSSHIIYTQLDSEKLLCTRCKCAFFKNDPSARHWLSTQCPAIGSDTDRPTPICHSIHFNRQNSHSSHSLYTYRGLVYCNKCGCRALTQLRKLGHPCEPPLNPYSYGSISLAAIRAGKLPPNLTQWPLSEGA